MKYRIECIKDNLDRSIHDVIQNVSTEFGAIGPGYGSSDSEVSAMSTYYQEDKKSMYFVAIVNDEVIGGCGIAPFNDSPNLCELKKLFLLRDFRGYGIGKSLSRECLEFAGKHGFSQCYLETLSNMESAIQLYLKLGFKRLDKPLTASIHQSCDIWMMKDLCPEHPL
jgi:putative acetyltransferase